MIHGASALPMWSWRIRLTPVAALALALVLALVLWVPTRQQERRRQAHKFEAACQLCPCSRCVWVLFGAVPTRLVQLKIMVQVQQLLDRKEALVQHLKQMNVEARGMVSFLFCGGGGGYVR